MKIAIKDLRLADTVKLYEDCFGDGVVFKIDPDKSAVYIRRVYMTTADFSYTGGVIPYIGTEDCVYFFWEKKELEVYNRKDLK